MKRVQDWGFAALIILLAGAAVVWVRYRHELADIRQLEQKAAEAEKLLEESEREKETPAEVNTDSVNTEEDKKVEVTDADIEKFLKELAAEGKISETDVEKLLEDVAAEVAEEVRDTLSPEALAEQENRRKARELWDKIRNIIGEDIHSSTNLEEIQELIHLFDDAYIEKFLKKLAAEEKNSEATNNLSTLLHKVDTNGNVRTSDLLKMVDVYESFTGELGEFMAGAAMYYRQLAQYATTKGYDEINIYEIMTNPPDDFWD